jgi:long-chain-fatty-acid--CoA ligase ACSBG
LFLDANGERWLRTGDLGRLDADGFLTITGRAKELLKTAGGENVAPVPLEDAVKDALPELISSVIVIGDNRKHLSALVTLRTEEDVSSGKPTEIADINSASIAANRLDHIALVYLRSRCGVVGTPTAKEAIEMPAVRAAIVAAISAANARVAVSNAGRISTCALTHPDFSVSGGELTPTLKLKRKAVIEKRAIEVEALYSSDALQVPGEKEHVGKKTRVSSSTTSS